MINYIIDVKLKYTIVTLNVTRGKNIEKIRVVEFIVNFHDYMYLKSQELRELSFKVSISKHRKFNLCVTIILKVFEIRSYSLEDLWFKVWVNAKFLDVA